MSIQKLNHDLWAFGMAGGILASGFLIVQHVLNIPVSPAIAYYLLALPPLYFYGWSEYAHVTGKTDTPSYHSMALILLLLVLCMYSIPILMTILMLPGYVPGFAHYSHHAPLALGIGLLLIRLHALGKQKIAVFLGLTSVLAAVFFLAIRIPEWILGDIPQQSPGQTFEFFALVLTAISYIFFLAGGTSGVLKTILVKVAHISDDLWQPLRYYLIALLLIGCHGLLLLSLLFLRDQRLLALVFLLLAGLWTIVGHQFRTLIPYWCAYAAIVVAILSGRFTYAWWPETWILWILLGLSFVIVLLYNTWFKKQYEFALPNLYAAWGLTVLLMVYEYIATYGLGSQIGLLPLLTVWGMGFLLPADFSVRNLSEFQILMGVWLYMPALFVFLFQGYPSLTHVPRTLLATLLLSGVIIAYRVYEWQWISDDDVQEPRVLHHLHWFLVQPYSLIWVFILLTLAALSIHAASLVQGPSLFVRHLFSMVLVQGTLVVYWFDLARKRRLWWATVAAELMVGGVLFSLRRGIPYIFGLPWSVHWDMLIGWMVAVSIVATRSLLQAQDRAIRLPIRITLFGLPILTAMYALDYRVDFEFFALIVLPLYSLLFLFQAYSERDRFVLSYAFVGVNAYLILLFLHQQFQSVQLYVTPVCLSLLILVEVFRDITSKATANVVRGAALCVLLGVAMFQAVVSNTLSPMAHLIVLILSSLSILTANVLRVKIFAALGLFTFIIDLVAIVYIVLSRQHIETLMVMLGGGLTVIGFLTLGGYYVYRQRKDDIDALFHELNARFQSWE